MIFAIIKRVGEVAEWLKAHDSKSCMRLSRIGGSNPPLSARREKLAFCGLLSSSEDGELKPGVRSRSGSAGTIPPSPPNKESRKSCGILC